MAISLTPSERETTFQVDEETMEWQIYTCQRRMITKLNNAGWTPYWVYKDGKRIVAAQYKLPFNAISVRSKAAVTKKHKGKKLTPEHLAKLQAGRNR